MIPIFLNNTEGTECFKSWRETYVVRCGNLLFLKADGDNEELIIDESIVPACYLHC